PRSRDGVLPRVGRGEGRFGVCDWWGPDDDQGDVGVVIQTPGAPMDGHAPLTRSQFPTLCRDVTDAGEAQPGDAVDRGRMVSRDRAVSDQPDANRCRRPAARRKQKGAVDELLEGGVLVVGCRMTES